MTDCAGNSHFVLLSATIKTRCLSLASCPTYDYNDNDSHKQFHISTIASASCCAVYCESFPANFSVRVHSLIWLGWVHFECACTRVHSEKRLGFVLCMSMLTNPTKPQANLSKQQEQLQHIVSSFLLNCSEPEEEADQKKGQRSREKPEERPMDMAQGTFFLLLLRVSRSG